MDQLGIGRVCVIVGLVLVVFGLVISILPKDQGIFSWVGRLPGDVYYSNGRVTVWIPITSMILISVVVSLISWVIRKL